MGSGAEYYLGMIKFFSKKEYQKLADQFSLGKIESIKYFRQGYQTPKAVVATAKGKFIIAKHNLSKTRTVVADMKIVLRIALLHEINFLNTLRGLPVPHYLKSRRGKFLEDFGGYAVSAYRFLEGKQPKALTPKMANELGRFLGKFHAQGVKYKKPMSGRRRFYDLNPKIMGLMYKYVRKQTHPKLRAVVEEVKRGVENNRVSKSLPRGPIHVDIKPDNELFVGQKLTGIIDFGNMYIDPLIFDVGKTIMCNCLKNGKLDKELMKNFLQGYESQRRLNRVERRYLKQSILSAIYTNLWVDLWHIPKKYVPLQHTLLLVNKFLPIARNLEKQTFQ